MAGPITFTQRLLQILRSLEAWLISNFPPPSGPVVTKVKPLAGWPGTMVTISGTGFADTLDGNDVQIGGAAALVMSASATELVLLAGEQTQTGPIQVTVSGATAVAPDKFVVRPWPAIEDAGASGPPVFFHGPQNGTPALGKKDQRVLIVFSQGSDAGAINTAAAIAAEMPTFQQAERFWREASYEFGPGSHGTSIKYEAGPWVVLPKPRNAYVWDDADIAAARRVLYFDGKRWTHIAGSTAYCAHQGGGLALAQLSVNWPSETARSVSGWIAYHVVVGGTTAFVAAGASGLITLNIAGPSPMQMAKVTLGGSLRGCDLAGNLLVAAAMEGGVEFYDVSNPFNPIRHTVLDADANWATAVKIAGNRAYVAAGSLIRVYDISNPGVPSRVGQAGAADWILGLDVSGTLCAAATDGSGLAIFDVTAVNPAPLGNNKDALHLYNVRIQGGLAYAAAGSDGLLIVDISTPASPSKVVLSATGTDCLDISFFAGGAVLAMGGEGVMAGVFSDPKTPQYGFENFLTATPPLGGDWDLGALRTNLKNAADSRGLLKGSALSVEALLGAKAVNPALDFNAFEGFVIVIHGNVGRGQSWLSSAESFQGTTVSFPEKKGIIWLPSGAQWGRKAHEVGHWFGMPDIYTEWYDDGTVLLGDAEAWDMAGGHDSGPLFSGRQADHMKLFAPANVVQRVWDPSTGPKTEDFEIVAHGANEDNTGRIHLLELKVADGLSYYVEVRQKPGAVIFDAHIPAPAGLDGCVLVTRVTEGASISNTFERPTMLFGVLKAGDSVADAARLLRIEAVSIVRPNPLAFKVTIHWNEEPPPDPNGKFDLRITPWSTDTWETPDIWINSPRNDDAMGPVYSSNDGNVRNPVLNGDKPWVHHANTVFARISNSGVQDVSDVYVTCYVTSPPGIGDNGTWQTLSTTKLASIPANGSQMAQFSWTPDVDKHTCVSVAIMPQAGEIEPRNNRAQENIAMFDSAGSSSHQPVVLDAEVRSPFSVWRRVDLRVQNLPIGWHAVVNKSWVWVGPKGSAAVSAVIWTDLNSPRQGREQRIPAEAFPRVEGWTNFADHRYLPIGGILGIVRANKRTKIRFEAGASSKLLHINGVLQPTTPGVPGVVEITDAVGVAKLVPVKSDASGQIRADVPLVPGRYDVQLHTASTPVAAEAESEIRTVNVPA